MQFSLKEHRLCRMEAPMERVRDPSSFPELEGRAKEAPTTVRDIQGNLADRRERYIAQLKDKSADTLRTELGQLTIRAAKLYRDHIEALLALRAKDQTAGATGFASGVTRAKANFLILLVQDHCRALYAKAGKMDPAIEEAVRTLAPLGIVLRATENDGKFSIRESGQASDLLYIQYERIRALIKVRRDIVLQRAAVAAAKDGKDKEGKEADLQVLVRREESLVGNLRENSLPTDDTSLVQAAKDTLLAARYLDIFGGKREAPDPPVRPPPKVEKAPDKRTDKEIKESLSGSAKKLETGMRTYMEGYVKRMKVDAAKRPLDSVLLDEAQHNKTFTTMLRQMYDDSTELVRRISTSTDDVAAKKLRDETEAIWQETRTAIKPLGLDISYSIIGSEFNSLLNTFDNSYMARYVQMLERLQEVRRLRKTARGDDVEKLRKEQADIEEWAESQNFRADEKTIDATLKNMRTTVDFYALDPQRAFRSSWSTAREEMALGKAPNAKAVAELNWAINALYWQSQADPKLKQKDVGDRALNQVIADSYELGWIALVTPGTTDDEYDKAMKEKTPYRHHAITFRKLVLNDESNEAEGILNHLEIQHKVFHDLSRDGSNPEGVVRGIDGKRQVEAEQKALRAWLKIKEAQGELKPERILSQRMHALADLFDQWMRPDDTDVNALLAEIDRRSKEVLGAGDTTKNAFVKAQVDAVNEKLLLHGYELQIAVGKQLVDDNGKKVMKDVSFVSLADPLPTARVKRSLRKNIRDEKDEKKKKTLEAALTRFDRRRGDEEAIEEYVKRAITLANTKTDADDYPAKLKACDEAREALLKRAKDCVDTLERSKILGRMGATARLQGYRVVYGKGTFTIAKER